MNAVRPTFPLRAALAAALLCACAAAQTEKGGLVPVDLPTARAAREHEPRRLALLVGIQKFDDPRWRALRFPEADARALAAVLRDPARGGFDEVEVVAPDATRDQLLAALARLGRLDRDERDTVVGYFSSH